MKLVSIFFGIVSAVVFAACNILSDDGNSHTAEYTPAQIKRIVPFSSSSVYVEWERGTGQTFSDFPQYLTAVKYDIERTASGGPFSVLSTVSGNTVSLTVPSLDSTAQYTFRIRSYFSYNGDTVSLVSAPMAIQFGPSFPLIKTLKTSVYKAAYSGNGKIIAAICFDDKIRIWNADTYQNMAEFNAEFDRYKNFAVSNNGALIAVIDQTNNVSLYHTSNGLPYATLTTQGTINDLSFDGSDTVLITTGSQPAISVWDIAGKHMKNESFLYNHEAGPLAVLHSGTEVGVVAFRDSLIYLVNTSDLSIKKTMMCASKIFRIAVSNEDKYFATSLYTINLVSIPDGTCSSIGRDAVLNYQSSIVFSPDDVFIITGDIYGTMFFWHTSNGSLYRTVYANGSNINCLSVNHQAMTLMSSSNQEITIWSLNLSNTWFVVP